MSTNLLIYSLKTFTTSWCRINKPLTWSGDQGSIPGRDRNISLRYHALIMDLILPTYYPINIVGPFFGGNQTEREADHSPPFGPAPQISKPRKSHTRGIQKFPDWQVTFSPLIKRHRSQAKTGEKKKYCFITYVCVLENKWIDKSFRKELRRPYF